MTLYEMNQQLHGQMSIWDDEQVYDKLDFVKDFLESHAGKYYMLLNNESHYYTLFTFHTIKCLYESMAQEVLDIVKELGTIRSINMDDTGEAIEFWIDFEDECRMFVLFNYDRGVVEVC